MHRKQISWKKENNDENDNYRRFPLKEKDLPSYKKSNCVVSCHMRLATGKYCTLQSENFSLLGLIMKKN